MADKNFTEYEFRVEINVVRRTGRYDSDQIVNVDIKNLIPLATGDEEAVHRTLRDAIAEAKDKAMNVTFVRQNFERQMLSLEAGDTIDA